MFTAEALAIGSALDFVVKNKVASTYSIITDSQSILRALSN